MRWPWQKKEQPKSGGAIPAQTLADIARGMQHAVNSAQEIGEQHYARMFSRYFDDDGRAKMQKFVLPSGHTLDVPIISLMPLNGLILQKMQVQMAVRVEEAETKGAAGEGEHTSLTRTSFKVSFSPHKRKSEEREMNLVDVTMEFQAGDPPEAVARLVHEYYANSVRPKDPEAPKAISAPSPAPPAPEVKP